MTRSDRRQAEEIRGVRLVLLELLLIGFAVIAAAIAGEAVIRLKEPRSDNQPLSTVLKGSERRWAYMPNRKVLRKGVVIQTNSFGQRGDEYVPEKPAGTFRIIGLGDSYTLGTGVRFEDTYLQVLQRRLQSHMDGSAHYEAINFGVEGYNTRQELAYFQEEGVRLKPDLVLLEHLYNDIDESTAPAIQGAAPRPESRGTLRRIIVDLKRRSHLFSFLSPRMGAVFRRMGVKGQGEVAAYDEAFREGDPRWKKSEDAILEIDRSAKSIGSRLVVVVFPALVSLKDGEYPLPRYHKAVTEFCRRNSIPVLDLYPFFEGRRARDFWISITDPHPNAQANRIMAEAICQFLCDEGLVPAGPAPARTAGAPSSPPE